MRTDWAQRWRDGLQRWRPTHAGGFDPGRYEVAAIEHAEAFGFVTSHHYSRSWPNVKYRYGLFDHGAGARELVGVLTLGVPMSQHALPAVFPRLVPNEQSLEWSRLVLVDEVPGNAESWFATRALRLAAAEGVLGVVTYADPMERWRRGANGVWVPVTGGHIGDVYKGMSMEYTGRSRARWRWILPDGGELTDRALNKVVKDEQGGLGVIRRLVAFGAQPPSGKQSPKVWLNRALRSIGARKQKHPGNHRYAAFIGSKTERRKYGEMGLPSRPYPRHQLRLELEEAEAMSR
jgi:hypothetical protein